MSEIEKPEKVLRDQEPGQIIKFGVRLLTPQDHVYIIHTWRTHYYKNGLFARGMVPEVFHENHKQVINNLLTWTPCMVAYDLEHPSLILGFLIGGIFNGYPVVHYAYVRRQFRGYGLAKTMLEHLGWKPGNPVIATHLVQSLRFEAMSDKHLLYNPYLLFKEFRDDLQAQDVKADVTYERTTNTRGKHDKT